MAPRKPSTRQTPQYSSLPFAGKDHITSSFILRGRPEPQEQIKQPKASTLGNFQASQKELFEKTKWITLSDYTRPDSSRARLALGNNLIKPLNDEDVAIKVTYDPTTIARDILVAANQHPTEKALNHHLMCLRRNLPEVKFSSDLATFRWDIVDPDPSTTNTTAHTSLDGSDTSMEDMSNSFGPTTRFSPERTYLEYIRPHSTYTNPTQQSDKAIKHSNGF
ncbi:hypothetical protein N7520_006071 [Penicillium odoratum]|uniref:uncharacterized protein n=1 Tax=Penicillium odoratum TaxID=1167516 RepID=UPI00254848E3|nr:uncharacterized protein N7520_006071 [Penicillium odoratum]KAJ5758915.1 hypothetical protein N7520_006071 [Penicillium odoratum]